MNLLNTPKTVDTLKTYTPVQFLRLVHSANRKRWHFNQEVHVDFGKDRYEAFLQKGLTCSNCGRKATQVRLEVQTRQPNVGCFEPYSEDNIRIQYHRHMNSAILCTDCSHSTNNKEEYYGR